MNQRTGNFKQGREGASAALPDALHALGYLMVTPVSENKLVYKSHIYKHVNNHLKFIKMNMTIEILSAFTHLRCYVSLVEACQWLSESEMNGSTRYIVSTFASC